MTDAGFFKGTSTDQDSRFADKKKKLLKSMEFGENLSQKVDMTRVNIESIRPWIVKRITELMTYEDDILCDYVFNQLSEQHPDPKEIQINMTGFLLSKNARIFLTELWDLLLSAMNTPGGVPAVFLEAKKAELARKQEDEMKFRTDVSRSNVASDRPSNHEDLLGLKKDSFSNASPPYSHKRDGRRHYSSSTDEKSRSRHSSRSLSHGHHSFDSYEDSRGRRGNSRRRRYKESRRSSSRDSRSGRARRRNSPALDEGSCSRRRHNSRRRHHYDDIDHPNNFQSRDEYSRSRKRHGRRDDFSESEDRYADGGRRRGQSSGRQDRDRRRRRGSSRNSPIPTKRRSLRPTPDGPICVPKDTSPPPVAEPMPLQSQHALQLVRERSPEKPSPPQSPGRHQSRSPRSSGLREDEVEITDLRKEKPVLTRDPSPPPSAPPARRSAPRKDPSPPRRRHSNRDEFYERGRRAVESTKMLHHHSDIREHNGSGRPHDSDREFPSRRNAKIHHRSPEGPQLPPEARRRSSPEGPDLPPTLRSVVKPVVAKRSDRRMSLESNGSSSGSSSSSSSDSSSSSNENSSSSTDSSNSSSSSSSNDSRQHRTRKTIRSRDSHQPPRRERGWKEAQSVNLKKPSTDTTDIPEGPELPPPTAAELEWKEQAGGEVESSSVSSSSSSSSSSSHASPVPARRDDWPPSKKRRHVQDEQLPRNERKHHRRLSEDDDVDRHRHHQHHRKLEPVVPMNREKVGSRDEDRSSGRGGPSSAEDLLRQRALESLLRRKKSAEAAQ